MKKVNKKKGISLIVLVITIIVMIILATAIILSLTGDNIVGKAKQAVSDSDIANAKHVVTLARADWKSMTKEERQEEGSLREYAQKKLREAGYTLGKEIGEISVSPEGYLNVYKEPVVPEGFVASIYDGETKLSDGFVIYQTNSLAGVEQSVAQETYNQFVWIPVPCVEEFKIKDFGGLYGLIGDSLKETSEPYIPANLSSLTTLEKETVQKEQDEYNEMKASVIKHGGFYVARYEAGDGDITAAKDSEGAQHYTPAHTVVSKKNAFVYNSVPWGTSMTDISPHTHAVDGTENVAGAVELARDMIPSNDTAKSNLIYGVQWDAIMTYLEDVINEGSLTKESFVYNSVGMSWHYYLHNYGSIKNEYHLTGVDVPTGDFTCEDDGETISFKVTTNRTKNIYDLSGNMHEWTMEAYSNLTRVVRGGAYGSADHACPASFRNAYYNPSFPVLTHGSSDIGFRVSMYLI